VLESVGNPGLCVDPTGATKPPALTKCATAGIAWHRRVDTGQFESVFQGHCEAPASKGKRCHMCLDQSSPSAVDLWDCKPTGSPKGEGNQNFTLDESTGGIIAPGGLCLTAVVQAGAGAEAMRYGDISFLSNMDGKKSALVKYEGQSYTLPNHTVPPPRHRCRDQHSELAEIYLRFGLAEIYLRFELAVIYVLSSL
jgi:hypothetical protein